MFPRYRALCRVVHQEATGEDAPPYLNWYDAIGRAARLPEFRGRIDALAEV